MDGGGPVSESRILALVTGGSGGSGRATALALARDGWAIALGWRSSEAAAKEAVEEIIAGGGDAIAVQLDVTDEESVAAAFAAIADPLGPVTGLVNNAGMTKDGLTIKYPKDTFEQTLAVNVTGAFLCTKAALRGMLRARWGRIMNISSAVALRGNPGQAAYTASKAALVGMTKSVAREVGSRGITVNTVCPGVVDTEMVSELHDAQMDVMLEATPVGRMATPEEIANVVSFLMSDEASYVNGAVVPIDGGLTA